MTTLPEFYPASSILMLRPKTFGFNSLTAESNAFQQNPTHFDYTAIENEFDSLVEKIRATGIEVLVLEDSIDPPKPDAVFLNNWISTHEDGSVFIYPMEAVNRRIERRPELIEVLYGAYIFSSFSDLSATEKENQILEGTGSMVLDHVNRHVFAAISSRTDKKLTEVWAKNMNYDCTCFHAFDEQGKAIYHTNVLMSVGEDYAVVCLDAILNPLEKKNMIAYFKKAKKTLIDISFQQMNSFAGNCIQLKNKASKKFIVLSGSAYASLNADQIEKLTAESDLIIGKIPTIETIGGGSVRCMIAENFLEKR
jgi:hypothetical protein